MSSSSSLFSSNNHHGKLYFDPESDTSKGESRILLHWKSGLQSSLVVFDPVSKLDFGLWIPLAGIVPVFFHFRALLLNWGFGTHDKNVTTCRRQWKNSACHGKQSYSSIAGVWITTDCFPGMAKVSTGGGGGFRKSNLPKMHPRNNICL